MTAPRPARRWAVAAFVLGTGVVLSACGVGVDAAPIVIGNKSVPYGLTRPAPPTTEAIAPSAYVTVYLEGSQRKGSERLVAVSRPVTGPVTVSAVLGAVAKGPTAQQAAQGLASPISSAAPLSLARLDGTVAVIDVSSSFTTLAQKEQEIAVAQLVYAVTLVPGVQAAQIRIHDRSVQVPTANGTLSQGPVTRADYASLAPY